MSALPDCGCQQDGAHDSRHRFLCSSTAANAYRTKRHHALVWAFFHGVCKTNVSLILRETKVDAVAPRLQARALHDSLVADVLIHLKKPSDVNAPPAAVSAPPAIRIVDFAIASPFASSAIASCRSGQPIPAGYAARAKEQEKFKTYTDYYVIPNGQLVPAVIETHGGFGHGLLRLLDELYDPGPDVPKPVLAAAGAKKAHMIRVLSVCVQTGNFLPILHSYNPTDPRVQRNAGLAAVQQHLVEAHARATLASALAPATGGAARGASATGSSLSSDIAQPVSSSQSQPSAPAPATLASSNTSATDNVIDPLLSALPSAGGHVGDPSSSHQPPSAGSMTGGSGAV